MSGNTKGNPRLRRGRRTPFQVWFHSVCDDIFRAAFAEDVCNYQSINAVADAAGLSHETVRKAYAQETIYPRLETLWKLCKAVDMDINIVIDEMPRKVLLKIVRVA
jgi:DNA-binding phage protein